MTSTPSPNAPRKLAAGSGATFPSDSSTKPKMLETTSVVATKVSPWLSDSSVSSGAWVTGSPRRRMAASSLTRQ